MHVLLALVLLQVPSVPLGGQPYLDVRSPLVLELGHVKVSVTASVSLRVQDLPRFCSSPLVKGQGLIDWGWNLVRNSEGMKLAFSQPLSFFAVDAGDWSGDDDGPLELTAFDCDGRQVAQASSTWAADRAPPFATLKVQAKGICWVRYRSGGLHAGSTFITNLRGE